MMVTEKKNKKIIREVIEVGIKSLSEMFAPKINDDNTGIIQLIRREMIKETQYDICEKFNLNTIFETCPINPAQIDKINQSYDAFESYAGSDLQSYRDLTLKRIEERAKQMEEDNKKRVIERSFEDLKSNSLLFEPSLIVDIINYAKDRNSRQKYYGYTLRYHYDGIVKYVLSGVISENLQKSEIQTLRNSPTHDELIDKRMVKIARSIVSRIFFGDKMLEIVTQAHVKRGGEDQNDFMHIAKILTEEYPTADLEYSILNKLFKFYLTDEQQKMINNLVLCFIECSDEDLWSNIRNIIYTVQEIIVLSPKAFQKYFNDLFDSTKSIDEAAKQIIRNSYLYRTSNSPAAVLKSVLDMVPKISELKEEISILKNTIKEMSEREKLMSEREKMMEFVLRELMKKNS